MKVLSYILASIMYLLAILYYGSELKGVFRVGEQTSNAQLIENFKLLLSNKVFLVTFPMFVILTIILIAAIVSLIIQKTIVAPTSSTQITTEERIKLMKTAFDYICGFTAMILIFILLLHIGSCMKDAGSAISNTSALQSNPVK